MRHILNRFYPLAIFLLIALSLSTVTNAKASLPAADFLDLKKTGTGKVIEVIDPLTVKLDQDRTIHLTGLNYPDLDPYSPGSMSVTALDILKDFLIGKHVEIFQTRNDKAGRLNRMGHIIAHLQRSDDKAWVQGTILRLGLARVKTEKTNPELADQMYKLEDQAINESIGLWSKKDYKIQSAENLEWAIGTFQVVQGRVHSVSMNQNRTFVNFGSDWRTDFTITIPPSQMRIFYSNETTPQGWNGKMIRARGWISALNGPSMEINHPQAVQLIDKSFNYKNHSEDQPVKKEKKLRKGSGLPSLN